MKYALTNDIVLFETSTENAENKLENQRKVFEETDMKINKAKPEYMGFGMEKQSTQNYKVELIPSNTADKTST